MTSCGTKAKTKYQEKFAFYFSSTSVICQKAWLDLFIDRKGSYFARIKLVCHEPHHDVELVLFSRLRGLEVNKGRSSRVAVGPGRKMKKRCLPRIRFVVNCKFMKTFCSSTFSFLSDDKCSAVFVSQSSSLLKSTTSPCRNLVDRNACKKYLCTTSN